MVEFYSYYKKRWYQHWWVRAIFVFLAILVITAMFFAWLVYKEVRNMSTSGSMMSSFTSGEGREPLGIAEMRALVESDDDPSFGPVDAKAVVVEFGDFECPFCGRSFPAVREVMTKYEDRVKWIYRDFPIPTHTNARKAAVAAECALDQGKFWQMHDAIYLHQKNLNQDSFEKFAKDLYLDTGAFNACMNSEEKYDEVEQDFQDGIKAGVQGTPTFYFNGLPWFGAINEEQLEAIVLKLIEESSK